MEENFLESERREIIGKQVKALRRAGKLPAIIYGGDAPAIPVSLEYRTAYRVLAKVSSSDLVVLKVNGDQYHTLVRERQRDVITGELLHVDFQVVSLTELVRAEVGIQYEGESKAIQELNSILVPGLESVEVESLPQDLPSQLTVDISVLDELGDAIYVKDILVPSNVTILNEPDEMVVLVTGKEIEEEEEEEEVPVDMEEPEVIDRGRRPEEEEEEEE
jgi:large subunit ribosomal protein L25